VARKAEIAINPEARVRGDLRLVWLDRQPKSQPQQIQSRTRFVLMPA